MVKSELKECPPYNDKYRHQEIVVVTVIELDPINLDTLLRLFTIPKKQKYFR